MKIKHYILLGTIFLVLSIFVYEVNYKENVLKNGKLVLLELVPVDPRSLMQGDYMDLRYAITRTIEPRDIEPRGFCILDLDENNVGINPRLSSTSPDLEHNEIAIKYFYNERFVSIGSESFFFEEGSAEKYEKAKYGGLKVGSDGKGVLFGLFDKNRKLIE